MVWRSAHCALSLPCRGAIAAVSLNAACLGNIGKKSFERSLGTIVGGWLGYAVALARLVKFRSPVRHTPRRRFLWIWLTEQDWIMNLVVWYIIYRAYRGQGVSPGTQSKEPKSDIPRLKRGSYKRADGSRASC